MPMCEQTVVKMKNKSEFQENKRDLTTFLIITLQLLLLLSHFSHVRLCVTPQTRAHCLWDSPGKNTGVGCHFLLQCMKVKSEIEVAQSCLTLSDPMDCSLPGSSVHGIFQARVLEWGAIAFSDLCNKVRVFWKHPHSLHVGFTTHGPSQFLDSSGDNHSS